LPEESAFFLGLVKKQIPRFARDDIKLFFPQPVLPCRRLRKISAASAAGLFKTDLLHRPVSLSAFNFVC
jgi:hypothetical protein